VEVIVRTSWTVLLAASILATPALARGQDFGVMESAETINVRNVKLRLSPLLVFDKHGNDDRAGASILVGYGVTPRFDLEGGVAFYDGVTFFGGNGEFWLVREQPFDVSLIAGLHGRTGSKTANFAGVDLTVLASGHATPRLELFGAVDLAFEGLGEPGRFTTAHLVPGLEYKLNDTVDFVAEFGVALNDRSNHYLAGGLAFYFQ
jgi:hypothetical protein